MPSLLAQKYITFQELDKDFDERLTLDEARGIFPALLTTAFRRSTLMAILRDSQRDDDEETWTLRGEDSFLFCGEEAIRGRKRVAKAGKDAASLQNFATSSTRWLTESFIRASTAARAQ